MSANDSEASTSDDAVVLISPRRTRIDTAHPTVANRDASARESQGLTQVEADSGAQANLPEATEPLLEVEEPTAEMIAAVAGENLETRRQQLQVEVAQLAGHLRERLREVDRREATLNARVAQLEADLRASRMWLRERELAFQERENDLQRQIEELTERAESRGQPVREVDAESDVERDAEARLSDLHEREQQIQLHEDGLRERRFDVDRQAAALRHAQQVWQQQREREEQQLAHERQQMKRETELLVAERESQLRAGELLLTQHAQQLDRDRTVLVTDRRAWEEQKLRQRQAIDELRAAAEAELTDRRARLDARQEWIERQKGGLEQVRDEALRLHRQSLEMRLLAEQLWSQITGAMGPAEVTQSIAQLRLKLAEHYRVEEQQLAARRDELINLSEKIAAQHRELTQLKDGVREWAVARQAEIEQQAAALVQRELALDAQQEEFRQAQHAWNADRRRYEQQIRDLTGQLRTLPVAA